MPSPKSRVWPALKDCDGGIIIGRISFLKSCLGRVSNFKQACAAVENSDVFWRAAEASKLQPISLQEDSYV